MDTFIFDMDGTLFDTEAIYFDTWLELAKIKGFHFDIETKYKLNGLQNEEAVKFMVEHFDMQEEEARLIRNELNELRNEKFDKLDYSLKKKGVVDLLNYLKENNKKIALASSSIQARVDFLLEREGLKDYFDAIVSGDGIKFGKPNPEIFNRAMNLLKSNPEDSYIIEDSFAGIVAANKSGASSVLIPDLDTRDKLKNEATYVFKDMVEFLDFIKKEEFERREILEIENTRPMTFGLTCPSCNHEFEVDLNTAIFPNQKAREDILKGDFGKVTCPSCGHEFILNYRFVYTDNQNKFMLVNDPNFTEKRNQLAFKTSLRLLDKLRKDEIDGFTVRMCKKIDQTREKIEIFENKRDDRVIELMKLFIKESDVFEFKEEDVEEFNYKADNKFSIKTKEKIFDIEFIEELYGTIVEKYGIYFQDSIADMIDQTWAKNFMKELL